MSKKTPQHLILYNCALMLFTFMMVWIHPIDRFRDYSIFSKSDFAGRAVVYGDIVLTQEFIGSSADAVEISVSPGNEAYRGSLIVSLIDDAGTELCSWTTNKYDIRDAMIQYDLGKVKLQDGKKYRLTISAPELEEDNAVIVALTEAIPDRVSLGMLSATGEGTDINHYDGMTLSLSIYREYFNIPALMALIVVFVIANYCIINRDNPIEKLSVPILIASGLVMLFILAPGSGPDEEYHYYSSYKISNYLLGREDYMEVEQGQEFDYYLIGDMAGCNANSSFVKLFKGLKTLRSDENGSFHYDGRSEGLLQIQSHLAPAIGILIGRLLGLNAVWVYTLGRICNMALYISLVYIAIRLIPVNKELTLFVSMTPMCMQQAASLSYDAMLNGLVFVFIGFVLKKVYIKDAMTLRDTIICMVLIILLAPIKIVYTVLALLLLLLPKDYLRKITPVVAGALVVLIMTRKNIILALLSTFGSTDVYRYVPGTLLSDPYRYIGIMLRTLDTNGISYLKGIVGSMLTGAFVPVPEWLLLGYTIIICLCVVWGDKALLNTKWQRCIAYATFAIGLIMILVVFASECTLYDSDLVMGIQGRYFMPIIVPLLFCFNGNGKLKDRGITKLVNVVWFVEIGYIVSVMSQVELRV